MSTKRAKIVKALAEKFKTINGTGPYSVNLYNNSFPVLKFWDEVNDYPAVCTSAGSEYREYMPSNFTWGYIAVTLRAYTRGEDALEAQTKLESLLADIETCINANRDLVYDSGTGAKTTEILITSITTDEGLLAPYGVGEITLEVRYPAA